MSTDRIQSTRFELKYRVHADVAVRMREYVRSYLVLDEFSEGKPEYSYHNHSVYLDSDDLRLYWDVINGNKNRFKLRVRFYDENPGSPVFFEIKRRMDNAILKKRCAVKREAVAGLLAGQMPQQHHLFSPAAKNWDAIQDFCRLKEELQASPRTHVAYRREAWVSVQDNSARVSFDRDVCSAPHFSSEMTTRMEDYVMPFAPEVILELKFTGRFPNWFRQMVEMFGVMQFGAAKYVDGVEVLGEARLHSGPVPARSEDWVEKMLVRFSAKPQNMTDH